jgi:hypothetical protein
MWRPVAYELFLFLLPFALYAFWLYARRGIDPSRAQAWREAPVVPLIVGALAFTALGMLALGHFNKAPAGSAYQPAHLENGKLVQPELK